MKVVFLLAIVVFSIIYANQSSYEIIQSRGEFRWPYGEGKAQKLKLGPPFFGENKYSEQVFKIEQIDKILRIYNNNFEYSAKLRGTPFSDNGHVRWKNFNLDQNNLNFNLGHLSFESKDTQAWIYGTNINCRRGGFLFASDFIQLIGDCLTFADFSIDSLRKVSHGPTSIFETVINNVLSEHFASSANNETKITEIQGRIRGNIFDMHLTSHMDMKVKIKIKGQITHNLSKNEIVINIKKAKAGFFNVRDRLFKELAKIQNSRIIVASPYLFIKLGDTNV